MSHASEKFMAIREKDLADSKAKEPREELIRLTAKKEQVVINPKTITK